LGGVKINPNIANERKTGPRTPEGKKISRFNALKTGEYSKLLNCLECNYCKKKETCQYFEVGADCSLQEKIEKSIFTNYISVFDEAKRLYKMFLAKGMFEMQMGSETADKWFNLADKQLRIIIDSAPKIRLLEMQSEYFMKKEIRQNSELENMIRKLKDGRCKENKIESCEKSQPSF